MEEYLVVTVYICLLIPMIFMIGFLSGKGRTAFGYMMIGITIGLIASQINTMILQAVGDRLYVVTNLTPICEEILKGLPVLFFAFAVSKNADDIIPAAGSVGIGFAIFENTTILLQSGSVGLLWIFGRGIGAGLMHVICTACVGLGMSLMSRRKRMFLPGTFSLLALAIIYHSIFNTMVETESMKYLGVCLPILTYFPLLHLLRKSRKKSEQGT